MEASFKELDFEEMTENQMRIKSQHYKKKFHKRRSIRSFSEKHIPRDILENCLLAGSSAPSGANKQPYEFVVIENKYIKKQIREAAEEEEFLFYHQRAPESWLKDLKNFNTNHSKPFLEKAPYLIPVFAKPYEIINGEKKNNYYSVESAAFAVGMFISALHLSGLACLTHTPSPMNFLNRILNKPKHFKPIVLLVVGHPITKAHVPIQSRKDLEEFVSFI